MKKKVNVEIIVDERISNIDVFELITRGARDYHVSIPGENFFCDTTIVKGFKTEWIYDSDPKENKLTLILEANRE